MSEEWIPLSVGLAALAAVFGVPLGIRTVMRARRRTSEQIVRAGDRWVPWGVALIGLAVACLGLSLSGVWRVLLAAVAGVVVTVSGMLWRDVRSGQWEKVRQEVRREVRAELEEEAKRREEQE